MLTVNFLFLRDMAVRANKNQLVAIWVLSRLGWSRCRIAKLKLPKSHHTITAYYQMACEMIESGELPICAKDEKKLRILYAGNTNDLDYLEGKAHHNECGGGKRIEPHTYNSDFKENSYED